MSAEDRERYDLRADKKADLYEALEALGDALEALGDALVAAEEQARSLRADNERLQAEKADLYEALERMADWYRERYGGDAFWRKACKALSRARGETES